MKRSQIAYAVSVLVMSSSCAHAANFFTPQNIYHGGGAKLYAVGEVTPTNAFRIPAMDMLGEGIIITAADVRYNGSKTSNMVSGDTFYRTKLSTKISYDGGLTWSDLNIINAEDGSDGTHVNTYRSLLTDPSVVYNKDTKTLFMFGLRNNVNLVTGDLPVHNPDNVDFPDNWQDTGFVMFSSSDNGKSWNVRDIHYMISRQINQKQGGSFGTRKDYSIVFNGPGNAMYYKGKIYVPIQAWSTYKDFYPNHPDASVRTSGFIVSEDNGQTWTVSSMLIPVAGDKVDGKDKTMMTSESAIFHYKGKIRLAVSNEDLSMYTDPSKNNGLKRRMVFEYDEVNDSWTEVFEDFIPYDVVRGQTSTHNLTEDVYLVGYTTYTKYDYEGNTNRRKNPTLVTNTGIKLQLAEYVSEGYSAITSDDYNIYVMYEGKIEEQNIFFKAIDWKHIEYANLNTQIRFRAQTANYIADKFAKESGYISGALGEDGSSGAIIGSVGALKGGLFIVNNSDLDHDIEHVVEYDSLDVAFMLGLDQQFTDDVKGTAMLGYMNSTLEYTSGAQNDVSSMLAGYKLQIDSDVVGFRSGVVAMWSNNSFERNHNEGLSKTADFTSSSLSFTNELFKEVEIKRFGDVEFSGGIVNTFFSHDDFREKGGEGIGEGGQFGANNATIRGDDMESHELFAKVSCNGMPFPITDFANFRISGDVKYAYELVDEEKWNKEYRTMSVERKFDSIGEVYSARKDGLVTASIAANIEILDHINIAVKGIADSRGEYSTVFEGRMSI